jgi:hypothetical protein
MFIGIGMPVGLTAGVSIQQVMLTPPQHLIPPLVYPEVRVCRDAYSSLAPDPTSGISSGPCF